MRKVPIGAWIGSIVILILIIGGSYVLFHTKPQPVVGQSSTGSTTVLGNGISVTTHGGGSVSIVPIQNIVQHPSLTGAIVISSSLSSAAATILRSDEQTLITELTKTPTRLDLWLQLGVDRKIGGDYAGAIAAWKYVATGPSSISYIAYGNLGDLYMNFDVNYPKAESSYKAAIAANPSIIDYYNELYMLYRYKENNLTAAANILAQGLKANPNNATLLQLQTQLQSGK